MVVADGRYVMRDDPPWQMIWDRMLRRPESKGLGKWAAEKRVEQVNRDNRYYDPPKRVVIRSGDSWWPGTLDAWHRDNEDAEWFGHVTFDKTGASSWYPPSELRPDDRAVSTG
ncbi:hypothetical protein [Flindersiella endophytica]